MENEIDRIIFYLLSELFQDLCQMQEHWMIEGNYVNVKCAAS